MKNFPFANKDPSEVYNKQMASMNNPSKDISKRLKCFQSLYKQQEHSPKALSDFFNGYSYVIFDILYFSIIRFHPSKFRLTSGYDEIKSLFTIIRQMFDFLDKERIKSIITDHGVKVYSLFYYTLDFFTKKEIRLCSFGILLRIIDAFINEKNYESGKQFESKQNIEKDFSKLPTELHEFFLISIEFNLYGQKSLQGLNVLPFQENSKLFLDEEKLVELKTGEWMKLIKENNPIFGMEELILKEFFHFTKFENKIKNWFILLQLTWLKQIFDTTKDKNKYSLSKSYLSMSTSLENTNEDYKESKKSILIIQYKDNKFTDGITKINVQKVFLRTFKSYLKILSHNANPNNYMSEENFRILLRIIAEFYFAEDCNAIILKILRIYTKYFQSRGKLMVTQKNDKYLSPVLPVICESQATHDLIYLELLNNIQQSIFSEIDIIDKKFEKVKLERPEILNEIIKYMLEDEENSQESLYKHILDIALNVLKSIEKPNINININANLEILVPFLKNILLYAIKLEASFNPSWKKIKELFTKFLNNRELMLNFNKLLLDETEKIVKFVYSEELSTVFQTLKINKTYRFRQEYIIQLFLYIHLQSKTHKCFDKNLIDHPLFLTFDPDPLEILNGGPAKQKSLIEKGCHKFNGWLHLMKLFMESHQTEGNCFDTLCDGISCVIEHLLQPEQFFLPLERGKPLPRPKYSPPAQTFWLIFENFLKITIQSVQNVPSIQIIQEPIGKKKGNLEYLLFTYKTFFKIFCEAKSEIPLPRESFQDFLKVIIQILMCDFDKLKDDEEKKTSIEICLIYTSKLFTNEYPGTKLLIPYYFDIINHIFTKRDFLCKRSHNEFIANALLHVTRVSDMKAYIDLLKNSCITLLKSMYGIIKKFGDLEIIYGKKKTKLLEYKQKILVFIQCQVYDYEKNLQLKLKNNTPTTMKKNKDEFVEDSQDFKNNFFALVFYILKDLMAKDMDFFKTIWEGMMKIMGNDVNNIDNYCTLCGEFLDAISFLGHDLIQDKNFDFYHSAIESMLAILNNSIDSKVKIKILNCLLGWIMNDSNYLINSKPKIFGKVSSTLKKLLKNEDNLIKDQVEVFFFHLVANFYNFPPRNQTIDNNKSLFNESALHYDVMGCLGSYAQTENPTTNIYKKTITDQNFLTREKRNSTKTRTRKNISKSSPFPLDFKHLFKDKDCSSVKPNFCAQFWNKFGLKKGVAFNEFHLDNRLCGKQVQEEINKLNQKIGNNYPDNIDFQRITLSMGNNTIFSFVRGSKNTIKAIIRNVSGKYAWVIKLFDAIGSDCIQKKYDEKGLEFRLYKNLIVQQESGGGSRSRAGTQTQELFELRTIIRKPEKNKMNKMLNTAKSAENIETKNDLSQMLRDIAWKIEDFNQFDTNHEVDFEDKINILRGNLSSPKVSSDLEKGLKESQLMSRNSREKKKNSIWEHNSSIFYGVKSFLFQNGFFTTDILKNMRILNDNETNTDQYQNLLNVLDQTSNRETIKIGVVYVGPNQDSQKQILMNQEGSKQYDWFLANLGKKIELDKHLGFLGGLKEINDGKHAIYFANSQLEIIYHVATFMPTIEGDDQQINKKRHVGNDHVTIIWSENQYEYRRNTIQSQYNCVVIVIYPMKHNLFKIQVFKKEHINHIFPWIDGCVFSENELVPIIRLFSLNAHRKARTSINMNNEFAEFNSYLSRKSFIESIINKFGGELNQDARGKRLLTILHNSNNRIPKTKFTKIK